jgi:hypothetical protein
MIILIFLTCTNCGSDEIGEVIGVSEDKLDPVIKNID